MRTVATSVENAITIPSDYRIDERLTVYKSRAYFEAFTSNHPVTEAKALAYTGNPLSEAMVIFTGTPEVAITPETLTVYVNGSGNVCLVREGGSAIVLDGVTASQVSRVGIVKDNGAYYIFYYNTDGWYRRTIDLNLLMANDTSCAVDEALFSVRGQGAIYPFTAVNAIILDIQEGAIRITYIDADGTAHNSPRRFFNPIVSMTDTDAYRYLTHYAGAVWKSNKIWVYFTNYKGAVISICYTMSGDERNGTWSEIRTAIPEDICNTDIGNVILLGNRIFICARFYRQEEFESTYVYTLLSWSDDGITFTMNRRVLCSAMNYRFLVAVNDRDITFASSNRIARLTAPYQVIGESTDNVITVLTSLSGNVTGEFTANVKAGAEEYFNSEFIDTGSYAKLELGQWTSNGIEYVKYHDVVVSGIQKNIKNGGRGHTIMLQTDGIWHTSDMAQPFYQEFQGNQAIYDPCDDLSNLVRATVGTGPSWTLTMDFWNEDGTNPDVQEHAAGSSDDRWTAHLNTRYADYPTLPTDENITIKVYGWSRAGLAYPESGSDPTPTDTLNDEVLGMLEVEDENGTNLAYVATAAQAPDTITNFPQTYFPEGVRAGNYPLVFTMPNPGAGKKIIRLGARVSNHAGSTVYYLERVEIPEVTIETTTNSDQLAAFDEEIVDIGLLTDVSPSMPTLPAYRPRIPYSYEGEVPYALPEMPNWYSIEMRVKNETDLPITGVKAFAQSEVLASSGIYVQVSSNIEPPEWQQAGDTFLHESDFMTINPGETKVVSIITSHSNGPTGSASVRVSVWFEYNEETTLSKKQGALINKKKGIPQLLFSARPYSAYNFEQTARYKIIGDYSQAGLIGFATDKKNFIAGYIKKDRAVISKFRDGAETKLVTDTVTITPGQKFDIRFWHRDGKFGLEYKLTDTNTWPDRGSLTTYSWKESDGPLAMNDDIWHIGGYSNIDPPRFRITGFISTGNLIGVLPLDIDPNSDSSDFDTKFGTSGVIDLQGIKYNYTGKITGVSPIVGPFGLRNIAAWKNPYNADPDGSYTSYPGGNAIEFTMFRWWAGVDHHADYNGKIIGVGTGQTFLCDDSLWKPWITTSHVQEILRNRVRMYADDRPNWSPSTDDKVWVTNGLSGVSLVETTDVTYNHEEGAFCYIDSDDSITMYGYSGSSVQPEQTIRYLLDLFCALSGTKAKFIGDWSSGATTILDGEALNLHD